MVELQKGLKKINGVDVQVVAISYDSVEDLAKFSKKNKITFPLLSDPESKVIKAFKILNDKASGRQAGIPHPQTFLIDKSGKILAKIPGSVMRRHSSDELVRVAKEKLGD